MPGWGTKIPYAARQLSPYTTSREAPKRCKEDPIQPKAKNKTKQNPLWFPVIHRVKCQCPTMNCEPLFDLASDYCSLVPIAWSLPLLHTQLILAWVAVYLVLPLESSCQIHEHLASYYHSGLSSMSPPKRGFSQSLRWSAPSTYTLQTLCRIFFPSSLLSLSEMILSIYLLAKFGSLLIIIAEQLIED